MPRVMFQDRKRYEFACALLAHDDNSLVRAKDAQDRAIEFAAPDLARLFSQLNDRPTALLLFPYPQDPFDDWLITGADRQVLLTARTRLARFLGPSYGVFRGTTGFEPRPFDPEEGTLHRLGSYLYPAGYYRWRSSQRERAVVLERIELWLNLEDQLPELKRTATKSYLALHADFEKALAVHQWSRARENLQEIRQYRLATADNLTFLKLRLMAAQELWEDIWTDADFPLWAQLPMPRSVRTVLLTAFHFVVLHGLEERQEWKQALETFRRHRPRLGLLLSGPFQWEEFPVKRVVAYQATCDADRRRLAMLEELDPATQSLVEALSEHDPSVLRVQPEEDPLNRALSALYLRDYATAEEAINAIDNKVDRTLLLIELAFHSADKSVRERAWQEYQGALTFEEQEELRGHDRFVERYLSDLQTSVQTSSMLDDVSIGGTAGSDQVRAARSGVWDKICDLEAELRVLIVDRYRAHFGADWHKELNPKQIEDWERLRLRDSETFGAYGVSEASLLDYSYLGDLITLINRQWSLFNDVFGTGKEAKKELTRKLDAVVRVRNPLAHNRAAPLNELRRAEVYSTDLLMMLHAH
jgi:hypothetical protein